MCKLVEAICNNKNPKLPLLFYTKNCVNLQRLTDVFHDKTKILALIFNQKYFSLLNLCLHKKMMCCKSYIYMIIALWIKNSSESHLRSYKQLKHLQRKSRKNLESPMGFEPMTSAIPVWCSTNWAMKPRWKPVRCEFNFIPIIWAFFATA